MALPFSDRSQAGKTLAHKLAHHRGDPNLLVLALPRGGVPVAREVAAALGAPMDIFVVRKLGVPGHEELAMGAIASGGVCVRNDDVVRAMRIPPHVIDEAAARERQELERREIAYRGTHGSPDVRGRKVIIVDDGVATGSTMRAAIRALREGEPARIILAVPVAAPQVYREFAGEADEIVCAATPYPFYAVGSWYEDFSQTTDEEIRRIYADTRG